MFHSIRWRLVASYLFLTLLTVSLVGILALSLVQRHVEQQEINYLTANAEALSQRALPLIWPTSHKFELVELVQSSSFLMNARVRILDNRRQLLADSGPQTNTDQFLLVVPPVEGYQQPVEGNIVSLMILPANKESTIFFQEGRADPIPFLEPPLSGHRVTIIRRVEGTLGRSQFFFGSRPGEELRFSSPDPAKDSQLNLEPAELIEAEASPRSEQVVTVPIGDKNEPLGYVELSSGPNSSAEALATTRQAFLLAAAGATLMALLVGLLVSRGLTAPLHSLTTAAGQMSSGNLSARASVQGNGEIGQLARQFNQMAERLEASFAELAAERDTLRRFIVDASHELRTPITTLRNFNELLQGAAQDDLAAQKEFLLESETQLKRLEWITRHLLNLSRLEAGLVALDIAGHDAGELLETIYNAFKTLAEEKRIALTVKLPIAPISLQCDRARLEMALSNLVDNALKFTPSGGRVELGAAQADQTVTFWVKDSGPGIDPADQPRLFERFYRGKNVHTEGSGLGLAIAQSVAQAHNGRISVESAAGQGSRFIVELPL